MGLRWQGRSGRVRGWRGRAAAMGCDTGGGAVGLQRWRVGGITMMVGGRCHGGSASGGARRWLGTSVRWQRGMAVRQW